VLAGEMRASEGYEIEENASGRIPREVELETRSFGIGLPRLKSFTSI
jgi:hypothetical protein